MSALKMEKVYCGYEFELVSSPASEEEETNGAEVFGLVDSDEEVLDLQILEPEIARLSMVAICEAVSRSVGVVCDVGSFLEKQENQRLTA